MTQLSYQVLDVFTDRTLAGNPLAVVLEASSLDTQQMQRIAREFNLSETVFVLPPENEAHRARIRIFTPDYEMPFAGHPTVGSAIALASIDGIDTGIFVLEENIGPVRCAVSTQGALQFAEFDIPMLPKPISLEVEPAVVAAALGLDPQDIGFENHRISVWSAGVPYVAVPVRDLAAAARARLNNDAWFQFSPEKAPDKVASAYVYTRETVGHDMSFHSRMFVPGNPSYEDPATGSAAAAFTGVVVHFDRPIDGSSLVWIEQGIEMGRPSRIRLEIEMKQGALHQARIGGNAVKVIEGVLHL
ncbi:MULTISPECIES: PhzF family phenazine biosynthesis protein [Mesorhizobium]|uniref:PhzF family phenazine biosynthesis protein n=1 Tax=Mesorhizobium denitrificans TaxID=2294114 RepID=A0A371XG09_9HYPH|nr:MULTISPECIES: PhzF family phenazine biosynthesis protein [Mesorhizobium]RFC68166.1 PhzF family phenazine biosynthesis protein [Mesorhizobium denitrificans]